MIVGVIIIVVAAIAIGILAWKLHKKESSQEEVINKPSEPTPTDEVPKEDEKPKEEVKPIVEEPKPTEPEQPQEPPVEEPKEEQKDEEPVLGSPAPTINETPKKSLGECLDAFKEYVSIPDV